MKNKGTIEFLTALSEEERVTLLEFARTGMVNPDLCGAIGEVMDLSDYPLIALSKKVVEFMGTVTIDEDDED